MNKFYKEPSGGYLVIATETNSYYRTELGEDAFEGRACILIDATGPEAYQYVNTTTIGRAYLSGCKPIPKASVPEVWLKVLV